MGLRDDIRDKMGGAKEGATDSVAEATGKEKTGFDPEVCVGCPKRQQGPMKSCGLCGCPTLPGLLLDKLQMTPEDCVRQSEHERRS